MGELSESSDDGLNDIIKEDKFGLKSIYLCQWQSEIPQ